MSTADNDNLKKSLKDAKLSTAEKQAEAALGEEPERKPSKSQKKADKSGEA